MQFKLEYQGMIEDQQSCERALVACKTAILDLNKSTEAQGRRMFLAASFISEFLEVLYNLPIECRAMTLDLYFTASDIQEWKAAQIIEATYNIMPNLEGSGDKSYKFPLLVPRLVDWRRSRFSPEDIMHRGSYVREYAAQHPDLETMRYDVGWTDPTTNQQGMLRVCPAAELGTKGTFPVFPRNILAISLVKELPEYLDEEQKEAVESWYQRETTEI